MHCPIETLENHLCAPPYLSTAFQRYQDCSGDYGMGDLKWQTKQNKLISSYSLCQSYFSPFSVFLFHPLHWKVVAGMGFGISFFYCVFFCNDIFSISFLYLWNFISSRDVKYFLVYFLLLFLEWKILHLFSSQISHSIFNSPPPFSSVSFITLEIQKFPGWDPFFFLCFVSECVLG